MVGTPNYVMSGYVNGVSRYHTIYADYWASGVTSGNILGSYDMGFRNSVVYPASGATRDYGFSVRCAPLGLFSSAKPIILLRVEKEMRV